MKPLIIILLGKSGSGKGTQAKLLVKKFGLYYIGSGDILRKRQKKKDFTGRKLEKIMNKGEFAPTVLIFKFWMDKMEKFKNNPKLKGFIMDGSPRKMIEAELLDEAMKWYEWEPKVILLDISRKEAFYRLSNRKICKKCGRIIPYLEKFRNLKQCDRCGGKLIIRLDDTPSAINTRLDLFRKEVQPVINHYKKQGKLVKINGEGSIEETFQKILRCLKKEIKHL